MGEVETQTGTETGPRIWLLLLVLLLLGSVLYFPKLGASDLWDPWEPKYAQTAREMAERGDWLIPYYRNDERLNKAPASYWLIGVGQAVAGVNETGARLPSAVLAILGAMALGAALAARGRALEGLLAGAALLTSPQWLLLGRFAMPNMPLAFFLAAVLSLALVLPTARGPRSRRWILLGIALCVVGAGMTDWPRGLLLPAWAVVAWAAFRWNWRGPLGLLIVALLYAWGQTSFSWPLNYAAAAAVVLLAAVVLHRLAGLSLTALALGALLIVLLVAPWFVWAWQVAPDEMSILTRYKYLFNLGETAGQHRAAWYTVVRNFAVGGLPWSALATVGFVSAFRSRENPLAATLAGTLVGGTLFYALAEAKMGHFYVVLQPAVAGLAALGAVEVARRLQWKSLLAAVSLALLWLILWRDPSRLLETATVKRTLFDIDLTLAIAGVVLAFPLMLVAALLARRPTWVVAAVLPPALLAGMLGLHVVPALEPKKSLGPLWRAYLERRAEGEPLGFLAPTKESIYYYSNNSVQRFKKKEQADAFLNEPGVKFLIMNTATVKPILADHSGKWEPLHKSHPTHRLFRRGPDSESTN